MKTQRRVVVTGMGAISPLGLTVRETWSGLLTGRSIDTKFASDCNAKVAACGGVIGDNYCSSILYTDAVVARLQACLSDDCTTAKTCLNTVLTLNSAP
jgi:3-oxoacyl-(acyl-carrier-protein) synthase